MTTLPLARSTIRDYLANDPEADLASEDASALFSLWERYTDDLVLPGGAPLLEPFPVTGDDLSPDEEVDDGCTCESSETEHVDSEGDSKGWLCGRGGKACNCVEDFGHFYLRVSSPNDVPILVLPPGSHLPLVECGPACFCISQRERCFNRVSQGKGVSHSLLLQRSPLGGLGLFAARSIPRGAFITTYAGELVSTEEARARWAEQEREGKGNYLLCFRESGAGEGGGGGRRVNIDPARIGGLGRFLNHSHAPNLRLEPVYRSPAHRTVPRIAFFAARDVTVGEELVWDYGCGAAVSELNNSGKGRTRCACGAEACDGWLPFDASL